MEQIYYNVYTNYIVYNLQVCKFVIESSPPTKVAVMLAGGKMSCTDSSDDTTQATSSKSVGNSVFSSRKSTTKSFSTGYVTVLEIGGNDTVTTVTPSSVTSATLPEKKRLVSKSCSRVASLNRKRGDSGNEDRSSSVPPATGTVLVRIKATSTTSNGVENRNVANSNVGSSATLKPQRKQSIKISSSVETKQVLKRSSSANAEIRSSYLLLSRPSLSEGHQRPKVHQDKAVQCRAASADSKVKVRII